MRLIIEVYTKGKKKDKIEGYLDGNKVLTKKKKLWGYVEDSIAKDKKGYPLLILNNDGKITLNEDWDYEEQGYLKDGKIFYINNDKLIFSLQRQQNTITNHLNGEVIYLRGECAEYLDDLGFFAITAIIFELFAGGFGDEGDEGEDLEELLEEIVDGVMDFFDDED